MTGRVQPHDHDLSDGCGPTCPPLPGRTPSAMTFHPLYCYEPCHICGTRGRHACSDGKSRLSNLNPGRYGEQHHGIAPARVES